MRNRFEYRVCQVQQSRVTFVNGEWRGNKPASGTDTTIALDSCQQVWEYLRDAGREGWELTTALNAAQDHVYQLLYLKRTLD